MMTKVHLTMTSAGPQMYQSDVVTSRAPDASDARRGEEPLLPAISTFQHHDDSPNASFLLPTPLPSPFAMCMKSLPPSRII